jgi:hypothetical protein
MLMIVKVWGEVKTRKGGSRRRDRIGPRGPRRCLMRSIRARIIRSITTPP